MTWSAAQYTKFEKERNRPIRDLLAQIPTADVRSAIDLGCGPGNSTELLAQRFPGAAVAGIDNSDDMIAAARNRLPDLRFDLVDIAAWDAPGPYDVIFANAALQWLPDHALLLPELMARLAPGGSLAVQMPDNLDEPAHRLMRDVAAEGPWADKLAAAASSRAPRHDEAWYYAVLSSVASGLDIWRTTYLHALPGGIPAIVEWFKGSGLRPFLQPLDDVERAAFLVRYEAALAKVYPVVDGVALLHFPRLFFVAVR